MTLIDPTARIAAGAKLGKTVTVGPFCVIEANVVIGDDCRLMSHVHITGHTEIGPRTVISPFAVLGGAPQSVHYAGEPTRLIIGADTIIREGVTMNTGTVKGGGVTRVGDHGFFMANSHVGHDVTVGDGVTLANGVALGGHCAVGNHVFIGGQSAVHQFTRIGTYAMVAGMTGVAQDIIPFGFVEGARGRLVGLNVVGMKRRGFSRDDMHRLRRAYHMLFDGPGSFKDRYVLMAGEFGHDKVVGQVVEFIHAGGPRPLMRPAKGRTLHEDGTPP